VRREREGELNQATKESIKRKGRARDNFKKEQQWEEREKKNP